MGLVKNGFIDLGNNLFINKKLLKRYIKGGIELINGETYMYGEFMNLANYRDDLYGSNKGDNK